MSAEMVTETGILLIARAAIFLSCRKYLLRSLYSNLQDLSGVENASNSIPMRDPLPSPITQSEREKPQRKTESMYSTLCSDVFAGCFSESCMLFLLLMFQGLSVFSSSTRLFNWRLSLFLLLTCILVLIPFILSLLLTIGPESSPRLRSALPRLFFSTFCVALYLFALSCIPLPASLSASDQLTVTATLSRLVVLGTIILGLLAGFGAVSSSWNFIPSKQTMTVPTEQDVLSAQYALSSVRDDLQRGREEAARRAAAQAPEGTWISRVMPSFRGDENLQELKGLEALEYQMTRSLDDLRQRRASAKFSNTFRGKLVNVGGRLFSLYCLVRYFSCVVNIFFPREASRSSTTSYPDVVTDVLAELLTKLSPRVQFDDVARATRHISLVLVGVIVMSSIRRVLRGVTRALRVTSRSLGASLMLLLLAQLMVIYLLSIIVQLRASFPPPPPAPFSPSSFSSSTGSPDPVNLFATIPDFTAFNSLFDWAFFLSASASIIVRWAANKITGPKEY
ncbi:G protein-coupled receptor 89 [Mycena alexandri]|uniref:G protein-coupled receptor 89 n=1 Tax=Mycena alexandri TaxID=1745969 RepID=A0AAD6T3Z8_9AGAR|nr:G protein-coupled receptor 89 [Mycena alexandri]